MKPLLVIRLDGHQTSFFFLLHIFVYKNLDEHTTYANR
jgi:hypothetical protein